jgi:hypothetical protein
MPERAEYVSVLIELGPCLVPTAISTSRSDSDVAAPCGRSGGFDKGRWPVRLLADRAGLWPARMSPMWACPCRKRRSRWSSGVLVLVDDASDPVVSSDPEALEIGYLGWERPERSGAGEGHMWPVIVVVMLEGRQDPAEVGEGSR